MQFSYLSFGLFSSKAREMKVISFPSARRKYRKIFQQIVQKKAGRPAIPPCPRWVRSDSPIKGVEKAMITDLCKLAHLLEKLGEGGLKAMLSRANEREVLEFGRRLEEKDRSSVTEEIVFDLLSDGESATGVAVFPQKEGKWTFDGEPPLAGFRTMFSAQGTPERMEIRLPVQVAKELATTDKPPLMRCVVLAPDGQEQHMVFALRARVRLDLPAYNKQACRRIDIMTSSRLRPLPSYDHNEAMANFRKHVEGATTMKDWCRATSECLLHPVAEGLFRHYEANLAYLGVGDRPDRHGFEHLFHAVRRILTEVAGELGEPCPKFPDLDSVCDEQTMEPAFGGRHLRRVRTGTKTDQTFVFWVVEPGVGEKLSRVLMW